ncbi:hypothetical protein [Nitrobacter winogradskyi]|uniref:hypothetical protein n=1 Tax=Nitrobacter winogradskyi TaxID=913 RepID=UPI0011D13E6F|nr:hypothetical protein [Nitrobacter winogradskyi]
MRIIAGADEGCEGHRAALEIAHPVTIRAESPFHSEITIANRSGNGTERPPFVHAECPAIPICARQSVWMIVDAATKIGADAPRLQTYIAGMMVIYLAWNELFIRSKRG